MFSVEDGRNHQALCVVVGGSIIDHYSRSKTLAVIFKYWETSFLKGTLLLAFLTLANIVVCKKKHNEDGDDFIFVAHLPMAWTLKYSKGKCCHSYWNWLI